jgi:hypothetical protein
MSTQTNTVHWSLKLFSERHAAAEPVGSEPEPAHKVLILV